MIATAETVRKRRFNLNAIRNVDRGTDEQQRINDPEWIATIVQQSRQLSQSLRGVSTDALHRHTNRLRHHAISLAGGVDDQLLTLAAAGVVESIRRTLGFSLFDVQIHAGVIVASGAVAEMQTGEGKTLAGVLPAYLHALSGRGVHVATTNQYLASRDQQQLAPVFEKLAMSTGLVTEQSSDDDARTAYEADVTFAPGHVFGFDYLRDQLKHSQSPTGDFGSSIYKRIMGDDDAPRPRQRRLHCAIVDEIDHVLIDDAVSPLILSGAAGDEAPDAEIHCEAKRTAMQLAETDFHIHGSGESVTLTDSGFERVYSNEPLATHRMLIRPWHEYVVLALRAAHCMRRNVDYVVHEHEVRIVDAATGRIFADRSWSAGLQQAVLAFEDLPITPETQPLGKITRQRFFRLYPVLAGMTGTADGCQREFDSVYGIPVAKVPLRIESKRKRLPDFLCRTQTEKWNAVARESESMHRNGRAVLIGTSTIEQSLSVAEQLEQHGLSFELLNGVQDADEASIISRAGGAGAITVATNLAGRGTDISLAPSVRKCGGLHVIVGDRNAFARVDRQLVGRCARCGDPGTARFFMAADDALVTGHAQWIRRGIERKTIQGPVNDSSLDASFARLQSRMEKQAAAMRRQLLQRDDETESLLSRSLNRDSDPAGCWRL